MPSYTFAISDFPRATGSLYVARFRDADGATVVDLPLAELTPGQYSGSTAASSASTTFTVEIRRCTTANTAGFNASTATVFGPANYEPSASFLSGTGGTSPIGQTTFRVQWKVNGTLTDVASVTLGDPTNTYGVRVQGAGTLVVAAGTAMTHSGTGVYEYGPITDATAGLVYEWYAKITDTDGAVTYAPFVTSGSVSTASSDAITSRAAIEATGLVNTDTWADAESDGNTAHIQAQFDRVVAEAQQAARETADEAGALDLWPLATTDAQYYALQRAATDFAVARLQQIRPEPVAPPKEPVGVTGERVARQKMLDVWQTIDIRVDDTSTAAAPVAETVTYYPNRGSGCCYPACGPVCG